MTCGDPAVIGLAQFIAFGVPEAQAVAEYLKPNLVVRLRALARIYAHDNSKARDLLSKLLLHPNIRVQDSLISWGKIVKLTDWDGVSSSAQLLILAGRESTANLIPEQYVNMLAHPIAVMRKLAIEKTINEIRLQHPGAMEVFTIVKNNPEILNNHQTIDLARLLERPSNVKVDDIRGWLKTNPDERVLRTMLLSTAKEPSSTFVDEEIAAFLIRNEWKPSLDELKLLLTHPSQQVRMFAYNQIFLIQDKALALGILTKAYSIEQNPEYKQQLQEMIEALK